MTTQIKKRVVILGGGFGGVIAKTPSVRSSSAAASTKTGAADFIFPSADFFVKNP